jgi:predicted RecA/RadA family phage recombinase
MKLRLVTLAAMAALATQAFAAPNTTPVTAAEAAAATNTLYFSGSSAAKAIISGLVLQNCTGYTTPGVTTGTSFVTFSDTTGNYNAYACRLLATNDWNLPENTVVVVNKRDDQGSGFGVYPVAYNTPIAFLNLAGTPVSGKYPTANHTADVGISDADPALFNVAANRPSAFASSAPVSASSFAPVTITLPDGSTSTASVTTVFSQVFGVAVTTKLYNALQAAKQTIDGTTTGVPSLPRDYLSNFFSQNLAAVGWLPLGVANADTAGINVCFRDQGSGTRVSGNVYFGQFPGNGASAFLPLDGTLATTASPTDTAGNIYINEPGSGGGVQTCLHNVNALAGNGYGIGLLTFGTAEVPADYKFVAVDGVFPSRDAAKTGKYGFWVESTIQVNKLSTASAGAKAWMTKFIAKAQQSTNLAQLSPAAQNGVFALPLSQADAAADDCLNYAGTYSGTSNADKFCSRYTRGGDNRAVAAFVK